MKPCKFQATWKQLLDLRNSANLQHFLPINEKAKTNQVENNASPLSLWNQLLPGEPANTIEILKAKLEADGRIVIVETAFQAEHPHPWIHKGGWTTRDVRSCGDHEQIGFRARVSSTFRHLSTRITGVNPNAHEYYA